MWPLMPQIVMLYLHVCVRERERDSVHLFNFFIFFFGGIVGPSHD